MAEEMITEEERRAAALLTSGSRKEVESTLRFLRDERMTQPRPMQQAVRPQPMQQYPQLPQIKAATKRKKTWTLWGIILTSILILALGVGLFYLLFA